MKAGKSRGFAYPALLLGIVVFGIGLAKTGEWASTQTRRSNELALRKAGQSLVQAIGSYYYASPTTARRLPGSLEDLLEDRRTAVIRRHLRSIPFDPVARSTDWGLVRAPDGGVVGIYSKSLDKVLTTSDRGNNELGERYSDWKFTFDPKGKQI